MSDKKTETPTAEKDEKKELLTEEELEKEHGEDFVKSVREAIAPELAKVDKLLDGLSPDAQRQKAYIFGAPSRVTDVRPAASPYIQKALELGLVKERQLDHEPVHWGRKYMPLALLGKDAATPVTGTPRQPVDEKKWECTPEEKAYFALIGARMLAMRKGKQNECDTLDKAMADVLREVLPERIDGQEPDVVKALSSGAGVGSLWVYLENLPTYQRMEDEATYINLFRTIPVSQASGNYDFETALFSYSWVDEGGAKPEVEPDGTSISWQLYKFAGICAVTSELLKDSVINLGAYITEAAARSRAQHIWDTVATGTGVGQPTGMAGIAFLANRTLAQAGANLTVEDIKHTWFLVSEAYRRRDIWLMNDVALRLVCDLMDAAGGALGTGSFLWNVFANGVYPTPFGRPIYPNNSLAVGATSPGVGASNIYLIDPYNYVFFRKPGEGFEITYSREATVVFGSNTIRAFQDNYELWRMEERYDSNMIDRRSSAVLTNVH